MGIFLESNKKDEWYYKICQHKLGRELIDEGYDKYDDYTIKDIVDELIDFVGVDKVDLLLKRLKVDWDLIEIESNKDGLSQHNIWKTKINMFWFKVYSYRLKYKSVKDYSIDLL